MYFKCYVVMYLVYKTHFVYTQNFFQSFFPYPCALLRLALLPLCPIDPTVAYLKIIAITRKFPHISRNFGCLKSIIKCKLRFCQNHTSYHNAQQAYSPKSHEPFKLLIIFYVKVWWSLMPPKWSGFELCSHPFLIIFYGKTDTSVLQFSCKWLVESLRKVTAHYSQSYCMFWFFFFF